MRVRVVCTLCVTIETFAPTIRFSSVDFPAFGSPISATSPHASRSPPRPFRSERLDPQHPVSLGRLLRNLYPTPAIGAAAPPTARTPTTHAQRRRAATRRPPRAAGLYPPSSQAGQPAPRPRVCCAARLEAARPSAARPSSSRASTEKTGAWSGPLPVEVEVGRRRQPARLRPFLQRRLGVAPDRPRPRRSARPSARRISARAAVEPAVEIDRRDHRLHRVAEQRRLAPAAGQHLGAAHAQRGAEVEPRGHLGAGLLAHQRVQPRRQFALRRRPDPGPAAPRR